MCKFVKYSIQYKAFNSRGEMVGTGFREEIAHSEERAIQVLKETVRNWTRNADRIETRTLSQEPVGKESELSAKLILDGSDESELFHAFKNRGESATKRKVVKFLRELDSQKGRATPADYWYAEQPTEDGLDAAVRSVVEPPKITEVTRVVEYGSCTLYAIFDYGSGDNAERKLFSFYVDELSFDDAELVGKTESEAHQLHLQRDAEYLRS